MRWLRACSVAACAVAACEPFGATTEERPVDQPGADAGTGRDGGLVLDGEAGPVARCDRTKPFGTPKLVPGLDTEYSEGGASQSTDGRLLLFHSNRNTGSDAATIFVAARSDANEPFAVGAARGITDENVALYDPHLLPGDRLFFAAAAAGGLLQIGSATLRPDRTISNRTPATALASIGNDVQPYVTAQNMYFASDRSGAYHIYVAARQGDLDVDTPVLVGALAGSGWDWRPVVTPDELTIYFSRSAEKDVTGMDIYVARRSSPADEFGAPERVAELSEPDVFDNPTWISPDECTIYFESVRRQDAGGDVWMAERPR